MLSDAPANAARILVMCFSSSPASDHLGRRSCLSTGLLHQNPWYLRIRLLCSRIFMSDAGDLLPGSSLPSHNAETVEALLPEGPSCRWLHCPVMLRLDSTSP